MFFANPAPSALRECYLRSDLSSPNSRRIAVSVVTCSFVFLCVGSIEHVDRCFLDKNMIICNPSLSYANLCEILCDGRLRD
jgi:hypothetical protein